MADPNLPLDSLASLSVMRRRLLTASPEISESPTVRDESDLSDSVDFDTVTHALQDDLEARAPVGYDEVEALLQRYQAEKVRHSPDAETRPLPPINGSRRGTTAALEARLPGSFNGEVLRTNSGSRHGLPPLTTASGNGYGQSHGEMERLKTENAELHNIVAELRHYLEENDPQAWEERLKQAEVLVNERDEALATQKQQLDEWQQRMQTHRFVPSDDDLAVMADELEKERCQLMQEKKKLEDDHRQLQDDEETLMKQMREMEVGMAKERADLARQRIDVQRLHAEIKHDLEIMQRGDGNVKDRLAVFQRRHNETIRPSGPPPQQSPAPGVPAAMPLAAAPPKPKDSGVFKRLFGQS